MFFENLDEELNKVNQFCMKQESEFVERGELLQKQLQALLELKQILIDQRRKNPTARISSPSPAGDSDYSG